MAVYEATPHDDDLWRVTRTDAYRQVTLGRVPGPEVVTFVRDRWAPGDEYRVTVDGRLQRFRLGADDSVEEVDEP